MLRMRSRPVILCADGYGLSGGVTRGILELGADKRISATSALVTLPRWAEDGPKLGQARGTLSIGLHLNLTLGRPLGAMPGLAPGGTLPSSGRLLLAALRRTLDLGEIRAEISRQIKAFEDHVGFQPDHIDSHQHVHVLPGIRTALFAALAERRFPTAPLLRDPFEKPMVIAVRSGEMAEALGTTIRAIGFGQQARRQGLPTNQGFSGYSAFDTSRMFATELAMAMRFTGKRHMVICHPGHPDGELAALSANTLRRGQELDTLLTHPSFVNQLWTIVRDQDGPAIDWDKAFPHVR
ncbi:MAG: ChbG/HpnK family deacetylase [Hyphomicrobiaceae bacterium]